MIPVRPVELQWGLGGVFDQMLLMPVRIPLGAFGEEIGWRGYLHKELDTRLRGLVSSVLVGLLWMPIHLYLGSKRSN